MKILQVIPLEHANLYGAILKKERELRPRGTFRRGPRRKGTTSKQSKVTFHHRRYDGWVTIHQSVGGSVIVEINTKSERATDSNIYSACLGWLDRHLSREIDSINIQNYP